MKPVIGYAAAIIILMVGCDRPGSSVEPSRSPVPTAPAVSPAGVTVQLGAASYRAGAVITAWIVNGTGKAIYSQDFKTDCSIAQLQQKTAAGWTDISGCLLGRPTAVVTIAAGQRHDIRFDPQSFHFGGRTIGTGTYRVCFTYRTDPGLGVEPNAVYSPEFIIQ